MTHPVRVHLRPLRRSVAWGAQETSRARRSRKRFWTQPRDAAPVLFFGSAGRPAPGIRGAVRKLPLIMSEFRHPDSDSNRGKDAPA